MAASCSRSTHRAFEKNAILRFENLSGNPQYDWLCAAAADALTRQLTGVPGSLPLNVSNVNDAFALGATRLVHGSFDSLKSFHVAIEDADTHKMTATGEFTGSPLESLDKIAHLVNAQARLFSTAQEASFEAWASGNFEQAVAQDPGFSAGWLGWMRMLAAKQNAKAGLEVADRAMAAPLKSPIDRAEIEALAATMRGDRNGRIQAHENLAKQVAVDANLWRALAEQQMLTRAFPKAVEAFERAASLEPDAATLNSLGYAQAYAGDPEAARKTFENYGTLPGQEVNALDSIGEAYFLNGKFAEAEKAFLAAQVKNPNFLNGVELAKVAYARFLAGNQPGADDAMKNFLIARAKQHDPLTAWREATWLYVTGQQARAIAQLAAPRDEAMPPEIAGLMKKQLAVWKEPSAIPKDLNVLKQAFDRTPPHEDGLIRTFYAAALLDAGQKDEARKLVALWPLPETAGEPQFQSLLFPKFLEVRKAVQ
jgi:Flp pilus assembly protein TadD